MRKKSNEAVCLLDEQLRQLLGEAKVHKDHLNKMLHKSNAKVRSLELALRKKRNSEFAPGAGIAVVLSVWEFSGAFF